MQRMSTAKISSIDSTSSDATYELGVLVGQKCKGGEVFELISDLGGGKTTFIQGLAAGLESKDQVASPTFMLEKVYDGRLPLHHFDFYRLGEAGIVGQELEETLAEPDVVIAIEWGDVVHDALPDDRVTITIAKTGESSRRLEFVCPDTRAYLLADVRQAKEAAKP